MLVVYKLRFSSWNISWKHILDLILGQTMQISSRTRFISSMLTILILMLAIAWMLLSCSQISNLDPSNTRKPTLSNKDISLYASSPALNVKQGLVISDNDRAFQEKIRLVQQAKETIDVGYYIYKDDYSSSVFSKALIDAANRGVRVRVLLDYQSTYSDLDLFSMLEHFGNQGKGSLKVRFYNRPTVNIIKDAVYLTLGCSDVNQEKNLRTCSQAKYKEIESHFLSDNLKALNFNSGGSGLFLSAFYSNNIQLMALAISEGQGLNSSLIPKPDKTKPGQTIDAATLDKLAGLGKIYIQSRHGKGFQRFTARLKLKLAFALFGGKINPYYDAFTAYFPIGREHPRSTSLRDWNYVKDFYHQKLLLVDDNKLMLGGRNIEDAYHMHYNKLSKHQIFMDTDVVLDLQTEERSVGKAFERLWDFQKMVASIADIRLHAPNNFLMAVLKSKENCINKTGQKQTTCEEKVFAKHYDLNYRIQLAHSAMQKHVTEYHQQYIKRQEPSLPQLSIDPLAEVYYYENLPFVKPSTSSKPSKQESQQPLVRQYGAINGKEAGSGKYIHDLWLAALRDTCKQATSKNPQEIIMHNAYVFFPSNLLRQLSEMVSGNQDCRHVSITVLTNSIHTTDLGIENYAARYSMKAFQNYVMSQKDNQKAAKFSYYEYLPTTNQNSTLRSLHSKVMIFGSDLFIGSANADVRSYMMDANNGLFIRKAPKLISQYKQWFKDILYDKSRTRNITDNFAGSSLQAMLDKDTQNLQKLLFKISDKSSDKQKAGVPLQQKLSEQIRGALKKIHDLSLKSLKKGHGNYDAQESFNELFKLI